MRRPRLSDESILTCRKSYVVCSAYRSCRLVKMCRLSVTFAQRLLMAANTWKVWRSWSRIHYT